MAFEEIKENAEDLRHQVISLLDTNLQYYKLLGLKIVAQSISGAIKGVALLILGLIILLFLSVAGAIGIGYWLDNFAYGFLIVGGIYILILLITMKVIDKKVEGTLLTSLSQKLFKD